MMRIGIVRQLEAVALAHASARDQFGRAVHERRLSDAEQRLKRQHVLALRAARETLLTLVREEAGLPAPGAARVHHEAMVAASRADQLPDFPPDFDVGADANSESP